jgi:hypothetical protein
LAIVLLVTACGFAYAGKRLRAPLAITRPGSTVAAFMSLPPTCTASGHSPVAKR